MTSQPNQPKSDEADREKETTPGGIAEARWRKRLRKPAPRLGLRPQTLRARARRSTIRSRPNRTNRR